jgi:hypothetical protein
MKPLLMVRCAAASQRRHNNRMSATESRSYRPVIRIHDICAEVERAIAGQPQLARSIELYLCRQTMLAADNSVQPRFYPLLADTAPVQLIELG